MIFFYYICNEIIIVFFQKASLQVAIEKGNLEIIQLLLTCPKLDMNLKIVFMIKVFHKILSKSFNRVLNQLLIQLLNAYF